MGIPLGAPAEVYANLAALPQDNVGEFYFKVKLPLLPFGTWHKLKAWGQLCDGTDLAHAVACQLWNEFPNRGRGWRYVAWRSEPNNPSLCKYATSGNVEPPKVRRGNDPYSFE